MGHAKGSGAQTKSAMHACCAVDDDHRLDLVSRLLHLDMSQEHDAKDGKLEEEGDSGNECGARGTLLLRRYLTMRSLRTKDETLAIPLTVIDAAHCRDALARTL